MIAPDRVLTASAFEDVSWHDVHVWGMAVRVGEMRDGDFTSDLVLDVDFIVEWMCDTDRRVRFRVAPAELVFHSVSDVHVALDWRGPSRGPNVVVPASPAQIDHIARAPLDGSPSRWAWSVVMSDPDGGRIASAREASRRPCAPSPSKPTSSDFLTGFARICCGRGRRRAEQVGAGARDRRTPRVCRDRDRSRPPRSLSSRSTPLRRRPRRARIVASMRHPVGSPAAPRMDRGGVCRDRGR